ncbi:MAG: hypothetical protein V1809_03685 [Planctomycetota bacterium]
MTGNRLYRFPGTGNRKPETGGRASRRLRITLVPILLCTMTLSGCRIGSFLRLLALKEQLIDFDRNVDYRHDEETDTIHFEIAKPSLRDSDVVYFISQPSSRERTNETHENWLYRFVKQEVTEPDETLRHIDVDLLLRNGELHAGAFSARYYRFMPERVFMDLIRALGRGDVDRKKKSISALLKVQDPPDNILRQSQCLAVFGIPTRAENRTEGGEILIYRYQCAAAAEKPPKGEGRFVFDDTGMLKMIEARLGEFTILIDVIREAAVKSSDTPPPAGPAAPPPPATPRQAQEPAPK